MAYLHFTCVKGLLKKFHSTQRVYCITETHRRTISACSDHRRSLQDNQTSLSNWRLICNYKHIFLVCDILQVNMMLLSSRHICICELPRIHLIYFLTDVILSVFSLVIVPRIRRKYDTQLMLTCKSLRFVSLLKYLLVFKFSRSCLKSILIN